MNRNHLLIAVAALGIGGWFSQPAMTHAQESETGVETLARGPVHEAYAELSEVRPAATPIIPKRPPEPITELPPDQKPEGDNVLWIPGYWSWDDERADYIWISGFWRVPPPGRQWVPGHWVEVAGGVQWTPGFWQVAGQTQVDYLPPPPPPLEAAPSIPAPTDTSIYVPGCWLFREARYVWRPGYWIAYRPNWVWVPAHYVWTPCGYLFVDGHWDYPLAARGLLFAPVYVDPVVAVRVGWFHRPRFVVSFDFMLGALFCRPGYGYYFGDYFEVGYARRGFTAWIDFRIGGHNHDPLYSYYRHRYAHNPDWDRDVRAVYVGRRAGTVPLPPRTLVQQTQVINNITVNQTNVTNVTNVTNIKNMTVLAPLNKVDPKVVKLQPVAREQQLQEQQHAQQLLAASKQRRDAEKQMLAQGHVVTKPTDAPRSLKIDLPKAPVTNATGTAHVPPPPPALRPGAKVEPTKPVPTAPPIPKKEVTSPTVPAPTPMPKKEVTAPTTVPVPKKDATPPTTPKKEVTTPMPKKETAPTPPPMPVPKKEVTPPATAPIPKKEVTPPPMPVPKKDATPPPVPKKDTPEKKKEEKK
jgi:hypothetical protein